MTPPIRIDVAVTPETVLAKGKYMISLQSPAADVHLLFEGPDEGVAGKLDEIIADLVDMRAALITRMARDSAPVEA